MGSTPIVPIERSGLHPPHQRLLVLSRGTVVLYGGPGNRVDFTGAYANW